MCACSNFVLWELFREESEVSVQIFLCASAFSTTLLLCFTPKYLSLDLIKYKAFYFSFLLPSGVMDLRMNESWEGPQLIAVWNGTQVKLARNISGPPRYRQEQECCTLPGAFVEPSGQGPSAQLCHISLPRGGGETQAPFSTLIWVSANTSRL